MPLAAGWRSGAGGGDGYHAVRDLGGCVFRPLAPLG